MKEFNLDAALNGEPFYASGQKCYIAREVTELLDDKSIRRFVVIFPDSFTNAEIWDEHDLVSDDIEMWEEPKISIEDLPKPFKPKSGDKYYYINKDGISIVRCYDEDDDSDVGMAENAQCYRTREDAQKWLDFMKSMME
jgi:hypothetical protein|nr:MAG TPA: hypothetical protein [Caudoviricetes sp.]